MLGLIFYNSLLIVNIAHLEILKKSAGVLIIGNHLDSDKYVQIDMQSPEKHIKNTSHLSLGNIVLAVYPITIAIEPFGYCFVQ